MCESNEGISRWRNNTLERRKPDRADVRLWMDKNPFHRPLMDNTVRRWMGLPLIKRYVGRVLMIAETSKGKFSYLQVRDHFSPRFALATEIPGGGLDEGELPLAGTFREMLEEAVLEGSRELIMLKYANDIHPITSYVNRDLWGIFIATLEIDPSDMGNFSSLDSPREDRILDNANKWFPTADYLNGHLPRPASLTEQSNPALFEHLL